MLVRGRLGTLLGPEGTAVRVVRSGSLRVAFLPVGGGVAWVAAGWYRSDEPPTRRCASIGVWVGAGVRVAVPVVA